MNFRKLLRKFFYEKVLGFRPLTVVLRHKVSNEQEKYLHSHKNFLNLKKYRSWEKGNFKNEIFLEIGFGSGEHLVNLARENKENKNLKILGVELYTPGAVKVLQKVDSEQLENLFVSTSDARDILKNASNKTLGKIFILFPDPWTKKRQFSRRLVNKNFLKICLKKVTSGGQIILATDWEDYAQEIENILCELRKGQKIKLFKFGNEVVEIEEKFKNIANTNFAIRAKREERKIAIFIIEKEKAKSLFAKVFG